MDGTNVAWQLEDFVDSLVVELDKTRETLAVKAINKPLSYTVRELSLDLNIFPSYDGDQVSFVTAQPGQQGSSKVTIQLGTITDQQVRATTKVPGARDEIDLKEVAVDRKTRKQLRKLGVRSADDIRQIEQKNVDLNKVTDDDIDYTALANQIERSRRKKNPPTVRSASMVRDDADRPVLVLRGENLAVDPRFSPVAVVNDVLADVESGDAKELRIRVGDDHRLSGDDEVVLTTDPFAVVRLRVKGVPK